MEVEQRTEKWQLKIWYQGKPESPKKKPSHENKAQKYDIIFKCMKAYSNLHEKKSSYTSLNAESYDISHQLKKTYLTDSL